jgi:hypothetical protein
MTQKTMIARDETSTETIIAREGDEVAYKIPVSGVVTGISSPTMEFLKEGTSTDLSGTYWTGSMSVSGVDTILTKTTQNLKAGNYVLSVKATVDGQVMIVASVPFVVKRRGER